jgi:hypothetical protein
MVLAVPLAAISATPAGAANGTALLTDVQAQDMGTFDRVTFTFRDGTPVILQAQYFDGPAAENPSGLLVTPPVAGPPRLQIIMSNASGFDFSAVPFVQVYFGPTRFSPNLPKVVELVQVEDFEATLGWVIGMRGPETEATAQVLSSPTRVVVDISHTIEIVQVNPNFTG